MTTAALLAGMLLMTQSTVPSPALDYPALAERLVRHMALQPDEKVLLLSYPGAPSAYPVPGHPLPSREVIDATYQRAVLQSDCKAIGEAQRRFVAALRSGEVRVTTPAGTDLR